MLKRALINFLLIFIFLFSASLTFAHVVVRPNEVGVGKFQTFTVDVPVEKEVATIGLRLVLPDGLNHVSPNLKPGWVIELKKAGAGEEAKVTEILWTGGNIPQGFRDEFVFSAQVPSKETTLAWKAYQRYADGSEVAWDLEPKANQDQEDFSKSGPRSETKIIDDLTEQKSEAEEKSAMNNYKLLTIVALIVSVLALALQFKKRRV